jgi:Flp pilus assembly protein CpaB
VSLICLVEALPQRVDHDTAAAYGILVATAALSSGSFLHNKDVMWQDRTGSNPPISRSSDNGDLDHHSHGEVFGTALRENVPSGEPIRRNAVVRPGDRDFLRIVL